MRISRHRIAILTLTTVTGLSLALEASAQGRKDAVVIEVTRAENSCRYEVKDVEGRVLEDQQDTFRVNPGAFLTVTATGTGVRVDVKDDPRKNVRGLMNRQSARLNAGESQHFRVRPARAQDPGSTHKVAIDCCERFTDEGVCVNPAMSDKMSSADAGTRQLKQAGLLPFLDRLVDLIFGSDPPVGSGGPDMDVDP